jgi:hypothetical protein
MSETVDSTEPYSLMHFPSSWSIYMRYGSNFGSMWYDSKTSMHFFFSFLLFHG